MYQTRSLLGKLERCAHVRPSSAERQISVSEPVGLPYAIRCCRLPASHTRRSPKRFAEKALQLLLSPTARATRRGQPRSRRASVATTIDAARPQRRFPLGTLVEVITRCAASQARVGHEITAFSAFDRMRHEPRHLPPQGRATRGSGDEIGAGKRATRERRRGDPRHHLAPDLRTFDRRRAGALVELVALLALEEDEM